MNVYVKNVCITEIQLKHQLTKVDIIKLKKLL